VAKKSPPKKGSAKPAAPDALDADALAARVDALLADPLYWFPVRHHSPAVARFLREAIRARRPKVVLIEGPPDADALVEHVVDPKTKPPIALYSTYRDDANVLGLAGVVTPAPEVPARFAAWYPLLSYSPEYVAMKTAHEVGAAVRFIDLPHHALVGHRKGELSAEDPSADGPSADGRDAVASSWEGFVLESRFYKELAAAAGYRTWDEAWDALFECGQRHADPESFRRDVALFCGGVRATTPRERMLQDGTFERERCMWRTIRATLAAMKLDDAQALVVTGGFHLFLDRADATPPPVPPAGTVYATVAPYSSFRVSELSGYGAGTRAPRYYQLLWDAHDRGPIEDEPPPVTAMVEHVLAVLARGRKDTGEQTADGLSSADAIAVTQHARMLASLRGRACPVLDDVRDAIVTCCVKGNPFEEGEHVLRAMTRAEVGNAVGRVTPALGRLPLVHDFHAQLDALDLGDLLGKEKRLVVALDRREEAGARRSAFLHRLVHLGVPIGAVDRPAVGGGTLFKETWTLKWSPGIEEALVEKNQNGDTVEAAAVSVLEERLSRDLQHAGLTCERLLASVDMDLPGLVPRLEAACGAAIDADRRFSSLAQALARLLLLDRHAAYRKTSREVIGDLIERSYARACLALPDAASVPEEEQAEVIAGLQTVAEAVLGEAGERLDRALFAEGAQSAAAGSTVPFLQGALHGLLAEIRAIGPEQLGAHVATFAVARRETMVRAGEYLDGVLAVSRTSILLGAPALVGAVDQLLRAADWEAFRIMLPRLRHAFERLHERQRLALCDRVAERYGLKEAESVAVLETSPEAAAHLASIDARTAAIIAEWNL
jgi:hypothetical protein